MPQDDVMEPQGQRPELLIFCGLMGLIGPLAMTLGVLVVQVLAPGHDPVSETISDLARGETAAIMDPIFYVDAAGLLALAIGAAHLHLGTWDWSVGIFALALGALVVTLLGIWDEFGGGPGGDGAMSVHSRIAVLLLPLHTIGPLAMARGAGKAGRWYRRCLLAAGVLWPVAALVYAFGPEPVAGLTERIAGATTLLWFLPLGTLLLRRGLALR